MMRIHVVTLFPEMFGSFLRSGLLAKAVDRGHLEVRFANPRDFTSDRHRTVDDTPYGGGSGMVMMPGPLLGALARTGGRRVLLTPQGSVFRQADAGRFAASGELTLVCGRYEGVDERVRQQMDEELSLGDFVLFGGEVAAMAIIEATVRLVPDVLGNAASLEEESHARGRLEYPQYTRPAVFEGEAVPEVLRGGNHAAIARFRRKEALRRTRDRRPDLLDAFPPDPDEQRLLAELDAEAGPTPSGEASGPAGGDSAPAGGANELAHEKDAHAKDGRAGEGEPGSGAASGTTGRAQ
jgi:tRNA (guanine37-N1)-methyltransferase